MTRNLVHQGCEKLAGQSESPLFAAEDLVVQLLFDAGVTYLNPADFPTGFLCADMVASKKVNQVERVALITVESTFGSASAGHSERRRLIIHPDLSVPPAGWNERTETVDWNPDCTETSADAVMIINASLR